MKNTLLITLLLILSIVLNAQEIKNDTIIKEKKNYIGVGYQIDAFEEIYPARHNGIINYQRKGKNVQYIARFDNVYWFENDDYSLNLDVYPKIAKDAYLYLNVGYGFNNIILPETRFGAEFFYTINQLEPSFGYRRLNFSNSNVDIYTAALSLYSGNYWFNARVFISDLDKQEQASVFELLARKYTKDKNHYWTLRLGLGSTIERVNEQTLSEINVFKVALSNRTEILKDLYLDSAVEYRRDELAFNLGNYINHYTFRVSILKAF